MYDINKVEQGFVDSVNSEIEQAVENIRSGNVEKVPDNIEVTKLSDKTIADLSNFVGFDVSDYSVKIERDRLNHIEKRHGINGNHDKSLSDPQDMARMGYVINNYDDISWLRDDDGNVVFSEKYNSKNNEASPILMMTKKIDGTYCLSYVVPDSKKKTLWITSARIQKADVGSQVPNSNNAPLRQTSETPLVSSSANNNIPQNGDTVKNEYMSKGGEVFTDETGTEYTRIYNPDVGADNNMLDVDLAIGNIIDGKATFEDFKLFAPENTATSKDYFKNLSKRTMTIYKIPVFYYNHRR